MSKKGTVTTMSEKNGAAVYTASAIKLSDIHADYSWNVRAERNVQDMADTESSGFEGFVANIHASGQITPAILRNTGANGKTPGKTLSGASTDKPYELVCGFRRHRAAVVLNAEHRHMVGIPKDLADKVEKDRKEGKPNVPNLPNGTFLAEVRDVGDVTHARILNGQENTARKNLKAQDLVFLVSELKLAGMGQTETGEALGVSQGWVSRLLKVASLPKAVLNHWRTGAPIPPVQTRDGVVELTAAQCKEVKTELTEPAMRSLAELKEGPEDLIARYIRMVKPVAQGEGDGAPDANKDKVKEEIMAAAALMGCMVRAGVLENGSLDWNRVIGPKKKGYPLDCGKDDSQDRLLELGDAAREAFEKEIEKNVNPKAVAGAKTATA